MAMSIVVVLAGCGTSENGAAVSASSSPSSGSTISSVPVPAGVAKDSVLDLNSTKDMTGVVTTVPIGESPYDENMPDICGFIPQSAMDKIGMGSKEKGFYGPKLVAQSCALHPPVAADDPLTVNVDMYVNNLMEIVSKPGSVVVRKGVNVAPGVSGLIQVNTNLVSTSDPTTCYVIWGTFYGTAGVRADNNSARADACARAESIARVVAPLLPRNPSQMRPTS